MKKIVCFSVLSLCSVLLFAQDHLSAQQVLERLSATINHLKTVKYDYHWITNFPSQHNYKDIFNKVYLDYTPSQGNTGNDNSNRYGAKLGFKFQVADKDDLPMEVYNGTDYFSINKTDGTMKVVRNSQYTHFGYYSDNSLVAFQKGLPLIIADTTAQKYVHDTIIDNKNCYLLFVVLKNKSLIEGRFIPNRLSVEVDPRYEIAIDKKTFLPMFIKQPSIDTRHPNDYFLTEFTNYDLNYKPKEDTWSYTTYEKDYKVNFAAH